MTKTIIQWIFLGYVPIMAIMKTLLYYIHEDPRGNPGTADE
ncbi:hypothetical protein SAMN05444487_1072 [Marininema mesophilum]|uniref:Uncharacterized protein n=1 Tax=Marininema mesophilum TaxID=1048340 RepID=A0A1H2WWW9_9BACL|nr:hypothetical protein [Marininema mesophilum]SDW85037.1 hypothetical protein SAMN05444487_1072 [Marininema mesophilum]